MEVATHEHRPSVVAASRDLRFLILGWIFDLGEWRAERVINAGALWLCVRHGGREERELAVVIGPLCRLMGRERGRPGLEGRREKHCWAVFELEKGENKSNNTCLVYICITLQYIKYFVKKARYS